MALSTEEKSKDVIAVKKTIIPDHLVDQIRHWTQWIVKKDFRCFLIVDSFDADLYEDDFVWLLEQGVRNPDGTRKFIKVKTETFVEQVVSGSLEYFDPVTFLKNKNKI